MTMGDIDLAAARAAEQLAFQLETADSGGLTRNPRTLEGGKVRYVGPEDWTSGFFPGSLWLAYELMGDPALHEAARRHTEAIRAAARVTWHHDVGFMVQCSFGNGYRLGESAYREALREAAASLATRWRPQVRLIQSWDTDREWMATRGWECPVIIDNMMNLELLLKAAVLAGEPRYAEMARSHADRTLENHYRPDGSCFHVVDYSLVDGRVRSRETGQGQSDASAWARGQAWGVYGFAMMRRLTGERRYLERSLASLDFIEAHPRYPEDGVPYWDFDDPRIATQPESVPRDASAAALLASALYELSADPGLPASSSARLLGWGDRVMASLSGSAYRAESGTNGGFILMHSTGALPMGREIDVPLNYADYYYLEGLLRRKRILAGLPPVEDDPDPGAGLRLGVDSGRRD